MMLGKLENPTMCNCSGVISKNDNTIFLSGKKLYPLFTGIPRKMPKYSLISGGKFNRNLLFPTQISASEIYRYLGFRKIFPNKQFLAEKN